MNRQLQHADDFWDDLTWQVDWYRDRANPEIAGHLVDAVEATLDLLLPQPEMAGVRSFRVIKPFHWFLIFYRTNDSTLFAERLTSGGRDLPRRLLE